MRYIRTENGEIYDISDGNFGCDDDDNWFIRLNKEKMFICLKEDEKRYIGKITANRDTVDELCDCYLEDTGKGVPCIVSKGMWAQCHKDKAWRGESDFYACIVKRDEKGPHVEPVAKLNKEMGWDLL